MKPSSRRWARLAAGSGVAALLSIVSPVAAQEPALETVLERAGRYVVDFRRPTAGAENRRHIVQHVRAPFRARALVRPRVKRSTAAQRPRSRPPAAPSVYLTVSFTTT